MQKNTTKSYYKIGEVLKIRIKKFLSRTKRKSAVGHDTPYTPYEVEPLPVLVMAHLLLMRILSAVAGLPTILWALLKP